MNRKQTIEDLFDPFANITIGFNQLFGDLISIRDYQSNFVRFPPHNIRKSLWEEDVPEQYFIDIALAGFNKEDIEITIGDNLLTIQGSNGLLTPQETEFEYIHQGIAKRDFTKQFKLAPSVKVLGAKMEGGTLTVHLEQALEEEGRLVKIEIE